MARVGIWDSSNTRVSTDTLTLRRVSDLRRDTRQCACIIVYTSTDVRVPILATGTPMICLAPALALSIDSYQVEICITFWPKW